MVVLIVDDDARSATLLAKLLRGDGYETVVTNDGARAIARLTRDPLPDAVISEFHLPHADGLAVARYARSRCAGMPIFFLTAHPHALKSAIGWVGDPILLLTKPVDYADLLVRLGAPLGPAKAP